MFSGVPMDFSPPLLTQRQKMVCCQDELVWTACFCPVKGFMWVRSAGKKQRLIFLRTSASKVQHTSPQAGQPTPHTWILVCAKLSSPWKVTRSDHREFLATQSSHTPPLFPINCNRFCWDCISAVILPHQILVLGYPSSPTLQMLWFPSLNVFFFWGSLAEAFCSSESRYNFSVVIWI